VILTVAIVTAIYRQESPYDMANPADPANPANAAGGANRGAAAAPREFSADARTSDLQLISGQSKKMSDYSGKVVVLDLWATWCGPCRQEIPHLIQMANEYKSQGVEVLGLTSEDPDEDLDRVRTFTRQFNINYEIGFANPILARDIMKGRNGIPQTLIIGRDGMVRKHFVGFHPQLSVPQMKKALEEVLAMN
jgi:thiol-disulfide isomerase/thioredoxin